MSDSAPFFSGDGDLRTEQNAILAGYRTSWAGWLATLDEVPPDRWAEAGACGDWSVWDLVGHVATWDAGLAEQIRQDLAHAPQAPLDERALDEAAAPADTPRPPEELLGELRRSHEALTAALAGLAADDPDQLKLCRQAAEAAAAHYKEHGVEVRARWARGGA